MNTANGHAGQSPRQRTPAIDSRTGLPIATHLTIQVSLPAWLDREKVADVIGNVFASFIICKATVSRTVMRAVSRNREPAGHQVWILKFEIENNDQAEARVQRWVEAMVEATQADHIFYVTFDNALVVQRPGKGQESPNE